MGFARLWRSSRSHALSASAATPRMSRLPRSGEDIEHASRRSFYRQILDRVREAQRARRVARVELGRHDRARPAADTGDKGDILPSVRASVADRLADDPAAGLEPPKLLA